jgi:hypothetical protein
MPVRQKKLQPRVTGKCLDADWALLADRYKAILVQRRHHVHTELHVPALTFAR